MNPEFFTFCRATSSLALPSTALIIPDLVSGLKTICP